MSLKMESKTFTFTWKVVNYSFCIHRNGEFLQSSSFITENVDKCQWSIIIYPRGKDNETDNFVVCALCRESSRSGPEICVESEISISLITGEILNSFKLENVYTDNIFSKTLMTTEEIISALQKCCNDTLVVTCRMKKIKQHSKIAVGCVGKTVLGVNRCSCAWNVRSNFHDPNWSASRMLEWMSLCSLRILLFSSAEDILIRIHVEESKGMSPKLISYRIVLLYANETEVLSQSNSNLFTSEKPWVEQSILKKSLFDKLLSKIIKNDSFTVMCYFSCSNKTESSEIMQYKFDASADTSSDLKCCSSLHEDLGQLLNSKQHCDMQLKVCDETFLCHKFILSIRAPAFYAMLEEKMLAMGSNIVDVLGIDGPTLRHFLNFVYTDSTSDMNFAIAIQLIILAEHYRIPSLKRKCFSFIQSVLSVKNVVDVLGVCHLLNDNAIRTLCMDFIKMNASDVLHSTRWREWISKNKEFGNEVLCYLSLMFGNMAKIEPDESSVKYL